MGQGGDGDLLKKCFIDSKTGDTIIATSWRQADVATNYLINFRMTRINSIYTLELSYHFGKGPKFSVSKDDSIWIKFVGGYRLVLYSIDSVKSRRGGAKIPGEPDGLVTEGITVKYNVSRQQLLGFAGNEIEKIRIFFSKGYKDINWPRANKNGLTADKNLTIRAAMLLLEQRKKYKVCEAEPEIIEPEYIPKEKANTDNF